MANNLKTLGPGPRQAIQIRRQLAAQQGDEDAKNNMTVLKNKMTPEQIAEGQKRACDFKPR